jgi:CheY-like chemotaxis protein
MPGEQIGPHICFVEDDPDDQVLLREALTETGSPYPYIILEDGHHLLELLHRRGEYAGSSLHPAIIILDIRLPGKDGFQILDEIRRAPELQFLPVIFLTSYKEENQIQRAYETGANSYLIKPPSFAGLVSLLKTLLHYWLEINQLPLA